MTLILPTTELRRRLSDVLDRVIVGRETIVITHRGRAQAVLLSTAEYETLTRKERPPTETDFYAIAQASLARIWEHPAEDVYTWDDGEPL
ncbi:MAG: type II toxin-antitoxin system Phd/YefM family antitoxin [Chloroflexi bacterium]|nr:type II toxin-antitoxin system Phd/YefM family antitoxin [Chloroflexota bacterium]